MNVLFALCLKLDTSLATKLRDALVANPQDRPLLRLKMLALFGNVRLSLTV